MTTEEKIALILPMLDDDAKLRAFVRMSIKQAIIHLNDEQLDKILEVLDGTNQ